MEKILIVGHEAEERQELERCLERSSYQIQQSGQGETALELISQEDFAVVILAMPILSCKDILDRALDIEKDLAVIVVVGVDERAAACKALEQGAYGYILTPLDKEEVHGSVRNALRRRKTRLEGEKYMSDLERLVRGSSRNLGEENRLLHQKLKERTGQEAFSPEHITSELLSKKFRRHRDDLNQAFQEISRLILEVTQNKDFSVRFPNPGIPVCYEAMGCDQKSCPCYGKGSQRCWQIAGTMCGGKIQGTFAKKYASCSQCTVYRNSTNSFKRRIGEEFNNMMHILEMKNQDLIKAYESLEKTQEQILQQEKMAMIGQLSAGVSHEIKSPLNYVLGNINVASEYVEAINGFLSELPAIMETAESDEARVAFDKAWRDYDIDYLLNDFKDIIEQNTEGCDRIRRIVANLKNFAHPGTDEIELVDINELVENSLNLVWNELKYHVEVVKRYGELPMVRCVPQKISQVVVNLLVNGSQAIENTGIITITTRTDGEQVFIDVSDTGVGISEGNLSRLFTPFFTTKKVGLGTGLGLTICRKISDDHGGEITVESTVGSGSTFTLTLPVSGNIKTA